LPTAVCVTIGDQLARYGFGEGHPFGPDRLAVFWTEAQAQGLDRQLIQCLPGSATRELLERFHTPEYVERVISQSATGEGYLDCGDTPAFPGIYEAACTVVGSVLDAVERIMKAECRHAFVPIAGLHHARRDSAAGFCVFNDCGIAIEILRLQYGLQRIAYVDIDAHHGDGVFYSFEEDADLIFADMHELNIPMPPESGDDLFYPAWQQVEDFIDRHCPQFILFQCGADSIAGDPITHLRYTPAAHRHAAQRLRQLAEKHCQGRLLAMGGGGYNRDNLARAWTAVAAALLEPS
jgi:acetoin utilization protein AcuC